MSKALGSEFESKPARVYDLGLTGLPMDQRPGIRLPTPENLQRMADEAKRQGQLTPQAFGQRYGIPREFAMFIQRLEARVIELEREVAQLRQQDSKLPAHLRTVETRG